MVESVAAGIFEPTDTCSRVDFRKITELNTKLKDVGMQLGKTLVFMKRTAFEALEMQRSILVGKAVVKIQAKVRQVNARASYLRDLRCIVVSQSMARVVVARRAIAVIKAKIVASMWVQRRWRGYQGREVLRKIKLDILQTKASTKLQSWCRVILAVGRFRDSIRCIIIAQSVARGYITRVDPDAMRESLILMQMELEKEALQKQLEEARQQEEAAEAAALQKQLEEEEEQAGKHPMLFCIATRQWSRVDQYLASDPSLASMKDYKDSTPLHYLFKVERDAGEKNMEKDTASRIRIAKDILALSDGIVKAEDLNGNTCIHIGAKYDDALPLIELVMAEHDKENELASSENGLQQYPLHVACCGNAAKNVEFFAKKFSGGICHTDKNGNSPLHLACFHKAGENVIRLLLDACDDLAKMMVLEKENNEGLYPLTIAVARDLCKETIELLVATKHAVLTKKDVFMAAEKDINPGSLEVLLENFTKVADFAKPLDSYGRHPLHIAVVSGVRIEGIELFLKYFPNATGVVDELSSKLPIELACESGADVGHVLLLLQKCFGATFKRALTFIASKTDDEFVDVLTSYLEESTQEHRLKCAVMRTGAKNSKLVSVSTPLCKQAFKTSLRYLGRYELSAIPVHRNEETGVELFRAVDYDIDGSDKRDVVLKFTQGMEAVEHEIYVRKKLDPKKVSAIHQTHATSTGFVITFENVTTLDELLTANGDSSGKIEHKKAVKWSFALGKCIEDLHKNNMAHGGINPKNVGVNRQGFWKLLSLGGIAAREAEAESEPQGNNDSPKRLNFGTIRNISPRKKDRFQIQSQQRQDMIDFAVIVARLFGVPLEEARTRNLSGKVQRRYKKAPMALLEGCFSQQITASYFVKAKYFARHILTAKAPSSTTSQSQKSKKPLRELNDENSVQSGQSHLKVLHSTKSDVTARTEGTNGSGGMIADIKGSF